ncbi:MAG: VWA domain-containing protein [Planctomycetia bacterium]
MSLLAVQAVPKAAVQSAAEGRLPLWGDYSLADPWFLLLIPLGLLLLVYGRIWRARTAGHVGTLEGVRIDTGLRQQLARALPLLEFAALVLMALALARPLSCKEHSVSESEGVDIALVIDRSGSMDHKDLDPQVNRLEVVKTVVADFATRRMTDREGAADNIALITFAAYPALLCPFTLDVDAVTGFLKQLEPVRNRAEDGTGIGIGLAKAVSVLSESDARSRIVVLLTDGENNIDLIQPLEAARLAKEKGIKVYTIFAGRFVYVTDMFGNPRATEREIDTSELEAIAQVTGGRFYRARDRQQLEEIYAQIEQLERTKRFERRYHESYDLYPAFLGIGAGLLALAWILGSTWLRRML